MIIDALNAFSDQSVSRYHLTLPPLLPLRNFCLCKSKGSKGSKGCSAGNPNKMGKKGQGAIPGPADHPKAYLSHMLLWANLSKITLHCASKRICATPELYGPLSMALTTIGAQTPRVLKSKQSVSAFKVMAGTLSGAKVSLRRGRQAFGYKWMFLAGSEELDGSQATRSIGLTHVFMFELNQLNYKAFEPLPGLYIQFGLRPPIV